MAQIVEKRIETVWEHGAHTKLLNWLALLPEQSVHSRPLLCIYHAWVLMAKGQPQLAKEKLVVAEDVLGLTSSVEKDISSETEKQRDEDGKRKLQGKIAAIRAIMVAFQGDIPAINNPKFTKANEVTFLADSNLVIGVKIGNIIRAYPLVIMDWHEVVNDVIDTFPIALTYSALSGSSIGINRQVQERLLEFRVSGLLYNSNTILSEFETFSDWSP